ncbi:hypothetical protein BJV74DRAFT_951599 [Russula compacta]|nr:hypothetical protein BJV74DRAFT_951599 [Russula compacta]
MLHRGRRKFSARALDLQVNPPPFLCTLTRTPHSSSLDTHFKMANTWPDSHHQQDHIPPTSDGLNQAGPLQNTTWPDANTTIQGCSCWWCSATRLNNPPARRSIEHRDPLLQGGPAAPYAIQDLGADNTARIGNVFNAQTQAQIAASQAPEDAGYTQVNQEASGFPRAQASATIDQPQVLDRPVTESLRHLAQRYINNPESRIITVRLEQGPSGRFQVAIMVERADLL